MRVGCVTRISGMRRVLLRQTIHCLGLGARGGGRALRVAGGLSERLGNTLNGAERLYLDEPYATDDGFEGVAAFMERRKPSWRHA